MYNEKYKDYCCSLLTTTRKCYIINLVIEMNSIEQDKLLMDLEYKLICEFIQLRTDLGLSQQQMADITGVVREMVTVIENKKKHPQINTLIKILAPLGYTLSITKIKNEHGEESKEAK